jgi:hypothetical protein
MTTLLAVATIFFILAGLLQLRAVRKRNTFDAYKWRIRGVAAGRRAQARIERERAELERLYVLQEDCRPLMIRGTEVD